MKSMRVLLLAVALLSFLAAGCVGRSVFKSPTAKTPPSREGMRHTLPPLDDNELEPQKTISSDDLKIGFLFLGSSGDYGFTYAQNQGRLAIMESLGVETMVMDNVPEGEQCIPYIQELINNGCNVIFSTSIGFADSTTKMAQMYPDLRFFVYSGAEPLENMSVYLGRIYQIRYLTGIVAGLRTQTNKIGYIAAHSLPLVIRGVNAFALGIKSVNPEAQVFIEWSNSWQTPEVERKLASRLIDSGCDVIAQHQNTPTAQIVAEEKGVWSIGYSSPMKIFAPNAYLTGALWDWTPYMLEQVKLISDGSWTPSDYWGGINDGVVYLDELTENVAPGTLEIMEREISRLKNGFDIFEGPIYDNTGELRVAEGVSLSDEELLSMNWFADNITVNIARKR